MASIIKEIRLETSATHAWAAVRDFGAVHERVAPGFLTDAVLEGTTRIVTFANGMVVRETLVAIDDEHHRLAYTNELEFATHHSASVQIHADGEGCRFIWITDVLPDEIAAPISDMMDLGIAAAQRTLEGSPVGA